MPREFSRTERVGEQIHRELAELIQRELKDPRVGMITLSGVEVSRDFGHAKIWFTVFGEAEAAREAQAGLQHAAGFLRRELARRMRLRVVPELHFHYDDTQARGAHLTALIDQAIADDESKHQDGDSGLTEEK